MQRHEAAASSLSPGGALDWSPSEGEEPLAPPWVSIPTIVALSPNTFFVLGERARVRGQGYADSTNGCVEPRDR